MHQLKAGTIHAYGINEEVDSSDVSFGLQLKIQCVQAHHKKTHKPACLITNLGYRLKQHENRNLYLRARLDTCVDVHSDTKKLVETTFYVATNDGSVLLSCNSTLDLDLIQPRSRLDYLPPRASLITSTQDHPMKTRKTQPYVHRLQQVATQSNQQAETNQNRKQQISKLITSKDQIMAQY